MVTLSSLYYKNYTNSETEQYFIKSVDTHNWIMELPIEKEKLVSTNNTNEAK